MLSQINQTKLQMVLSCDGHCHYSDCLLYNAENKTCEKKKFLNMVVIILNETTPKELQDPEDFN